MACDFSFYNSFEHLLISGNKNEKEEKKLLKQQTAKENWLHLTDMNVRKANFICVGIDAIPALKENLAQSNIYENQLAKYVNTESCRVSVLNSFPIFLYDYFRDITNLCWFIRTKSLWFPLFSILFCYNITSVLYWTLFSCILNTIQSYIESYSVVYWITPLQKVFCEGMDCDGLMVWSGCFWALKCCYKMKFGDVIFKTLLFIVFFLFCIYV